jgi:hypothetical protein
MQKVLDATTSAGGVTFTDNPGFREGLRQKIDLAGQESAIQKEF